MPSAYGGGLPAQSSRAASYDGGLPQDFDFGFDLGPASPQLPQRQAANPSRPAHFFPPPGFSPDASGPLAFRGNPGAYSGYFGVESASSYDDMNNNVYPIISGSRRTAPLPSVHLNLGHSNLVTSSSSPPMSQESLSNLEKEFSALNYSGQDAWTQPPSYNPPTNLRQISVNSLFAKNSRESSSLPPRSEQPSAPHPQSNLHNETKAKALLSILRAPQIIHDHKSVENNISMENAERDADILENAESKGGLIESTEDIVNQEEKKKSKKQGPLRSSNFAFFWFTT